MSKLISRKSQIIRTLEIEGDEDSGSDTEVNDEANSKEIFIQKTMWNQLRNLLKKKKENSNSKEESRLRRKTTRSEKRSRSELKHADSLPTQPSSMLQSSKLSASPREEWTPSSSPRNKDERNTTIFNNFLNSHPNSRKDPRKSVIISASRSSSATTILEKVDKEKRIRDVVAQFATKSTSTPNVDMKSNKRATSDRSGGRKPKSNTDSKIHRKQQQEQEQGMKSGFFSTLQPSSTNDYIRNLIETDIEDPNVEIPHLDLDRANSYSEFDLSKDNLSVLQSELDMLREFSTVESQLNLSDYMPSAGAAELDGISLQEEVYSEAKDFMEKAALGRSASIDLPNGAAFMLFRGQFLEILNQIGKGGTATVFKAKMADQIIAMKVISLSAVKDRKRMRQVLAAEVEMMKEFRHPNVIRYYGHFYQRKEQEMNVVLELVEGGCLTKLITRLQRFPEKLTAHVLHQVLCGLCFLHSNSIIHRDLKPDNMLIDFETGFVKLIDFGAATKVLGMKSCRRSVVGTPWYTAPEVIKEEEYSYPADIWSLGCSAIEMLSGKPPYSHLNAIAALFTMADTPPSIPEDISPTCHEFISRCLTLDRRKRPFALDLFESRLFELEIDSRMYKLAQASGLSEMPVTDYNADYLRVIKEHDPALSQTPS